MNRFQRAVRLRVAMWLDAVAVRLVRSADRIHPPLWTPFGPTGTLRPDLVKQGWHHTGAIVVDAKVYPTFTREG